MAGRKGKCVLIVDKWRTMNLDSMRFVKLRKK